MPKSKPVDFPFESFLVAAGAVFELRIAEYGQGYASTADFNFRYSIDKVEIGVRATFDRWANSADFVCEPVPATQEDFGALMTALRKVISEKRPRPEFGGFDIWPFLRQARRAARNADRIAAACQLAA